MAPKDQIPFSFVNKEFLHAKEGRVVRILSEFLEPEYRFRKFGIDDTIVFFGSARLLPRRTALANLRKAKNSGSKSGLPQAERDLANSRYYEDAADLARRLAEWNRSQKTEYAICTGGGPGIMEAANKGAHAARAHSIGLNIALPFEQKANPYIASHLLFDFHYFFLRKFWFVYTAKAIIMFPGGFGTLDEMMEVLTLIQTGRITKPMAVVLYGSAFWKRVLDFEYLAETGLIDSKDLDLFRFCDDVGTAFSHITGSLTANRKRKGKSGKRK